MRRFVCFDQLTKNERSGHLPIRAVPAAVVVVVVVVIPNSRTIRLHLLLSRLPINNKTTKFVAAAAVVVVAV